ncbi:hypothetical protein WJX82_009144 [Trebouxia sp. C0006]
MTANQASAAQQTEAVKQESDADGQLKIARVRSDILSDAEDEHGPSSPHFYSQSVRKSSRSLDSYISDIENSAPDNAHDTKFDPSQNDPESDQQVHEQAVRLDLLRRQHSARARQTLEHLQNTAAPSSGSQASESPRGGPSETRRSNSGLSVDMVREQSQQLKQASGDLKRLAEEQRTLAEEAVATFLLQEDMMMGEGEDSEQQEGSQHAGLSQALNDVFEDNQGNSRTSLTRQLEKIRRAEQAIKDAEADERIADQLAALQITLSQLAEHEAAVDGSANAEADTTGGAKYHRSDSNDKVSPILPAGRHLLKDISENSQEGSSSDQPAKTPKGVSDPSVDALILQSLKADVTSPASGSSSHAFDAALQDGVSAAVTTGITAEPGSSQGALAGTQALGSVTRAAADSPTQEATSARDVAAAPAGAEADDIPMYTLDSDNEDDLAVVSNVEQAREAQAAADKFIHSSRPATPERDPPPQDAPSHASSLPPAPPGPQQQEEDAQTEAAAAETDTSRPFTSDYLEEGRMADAFEPDEFKGMLFHDGVDSQGRPVIVVNTDAVGTARKARSQALQYMLHRLEPIVTQGPYVLVMVATGQHQKSNKLPAMWLISAYRSLSRPFRKNVRYILLVRPTGGLKALVACIRPFVSAKAARKVRKVESLADIAAATSGEVTIQHLGTRFAAAAGDYFLEGAAAQASAVNTYDMPQF